MRRHRANQIVDTFSKYALVLYGNCQQKLINGDVTNFNNCYNKPNPTFADAGIGNLPAGVEIWIDGTPSQAPMFLHNDTTGVDEVSFSTHFDDDKLCQAVASITGSTCNNGSILITIKQN